MLAKQTYRFVFMHWFMLVAWGYFRMFVIFNMHSMSDIDISWTEISKLQDNFC